MILIYIWNCKGGGAEGAAGTSAGRNSVKEKKGGKFSSMDSKIIVRIKKACFDYRRDFELTTTQTKIVTNCGDVEQVVDVVKDALTAEDADTIKKITIRLDQKEQD